MNAWSTLSDLFSRIYIFLQICLLQVYILAGDSSVDKQLTAMLLYTGAMSTSPQPDLSFLAGLSPDLYQSIGNSLGIFNDNGKTVDLYLCDIEVITSYNLRLLL